jgi:signal transduction histidine kinase/HAMP domain-containing protein
MPTRRRLSQLLLVTHVGLVLLFAVIVLATAFGTIRAAVIAQARAEAERAVSESRRRLLEWQRELDVGADLLAEQPTLRFYLQRHQSTKARALVKDFHGTSAIEYVQVRFSGETIAEVGPRPPQFEPGLVFDRNGEAWRVVQRPIESLPEATIVVAERLGNRLSEGNTNALISRRVEALRGPASKTADLWEQTLARVSQSGEPDTIEGVDGSAAARVVVLRNSEGRPGALLSARVAQDWVQRRIVEWFAVFALASLLTAALALIVAIYVSSRVGRPFDELARDARRLGVGDFETPVAAPDSLVVEPIAFADSLEQMRVRVSALTANDRKQREHLDAILDGVDEGIVGIDTEQRVHYANRQFLALVGRERDQVIGRRIDELLLSRDPAGLTLPDIGPVLERSAAVGSLRPLLVRRQAASGEGQVLVVREETAIESARAMRDRILANLSHEFQTPISAQMASIELLRDRLKGGSDPMAVQLAESQYRGTMRLSHLVENLLDSVRIESGEMRLRNEPVDLVSVTLGAIELVKPLTDQRGQKVVSNLSSGPIIAGDPQRLYSVMVNLLANANKFAPSRTTIWVDLEWSTDFATIWVEDEGAGLPTLQGAGDLFAPFRRSPHEEPSQRGTGLGLAIVKAIVVAHGGEVLVAPPVQRQGARIGITLPIGEQS